MRAIVLQEWSKRKIKITIAQDEIRIKYPSTSSGELAGIQQYAEQIAAYFESDHPTMRGYPVISSHKFLPMWYILMRNGTSSINRSFVFVDGKVIEKKGN